MAAASRAHPCSRRRQLSSNSASEPPPATKYRRAAERGLRVRQVHEQRLTGDEVERRVGEVKRPHVADAELEPPAQLQLLCPGTRGAHPLWLQVDSVDGDVGPQHGGEQERPVSLAA